jgi:hypothetical protein
MDLFAGRVMRPMVHFEDDVSPTVMRQFVCDRIAMHR